MQFLQIDQLLAALDLPAAARVDQRVPKKLLVENGAPTAADKRHINEGIEAFQWLAALNLIISLAHKRWAQNEAGKMVQEGEIVEAELASLTHNLSEIERECLSAFSLSRQPRTHLLDLYQGWNDTLLALNAARVTGVFILPSNTEQVAARRQALIELSRLDADIAKLRAAASKEKQIARQVELNLKLKNMVAAKSAARARL